MVLSFQLSSSAPFLNIIQDILNPQQRRSGKAIDDGYGVPEDSYGVPEDSYGVPETDSYEAPKPQYSSTARPCTTTTTAAPSYGAPREQQPAFPDILGFIGNILNKHNNNNNNQYDCVPDDGYGVPSSSAYEVPQSSSYEAPQSSAYETPKSSSYEAPQSSSYEAPQESSYQAPEVETYEAPTSQAPTYSN